MSQPAQYDLHNQRRSAWRRWFWPEHQSEQYRSIHTAPREWAQAIRKITSGVNQQSLPSFRWQVFIIAGLGFLTESYSLFESNVILEPISYVYWTGHSNALESAFNLVTLGASMVGQLCFGIAVDIYGRRSLWGLELVVVLIATLGLLQSSAGFVDPGTGDTTWSITPWLLFWRVVMGIGIGAEYPLSAIIAAEWSPTAARARVMASVFLMQPLGQFLAYGIGLLCLLNPATGQSTMLSVDRFWRVIVGAGAAPALIAYIFRRSIPESWRFDYLVQMGPMKTTHDQFYASHGDPYTGVEQSQQDNPKSDTAGSNLELNPMSLQRLRPLPPARMSTTGLLGGGKGGSSNREISPSRSRSRSSMPSNNTDETLLTPGWQFERNRMWQYLCARAHPSKPLRNWHRVLGTCACWFFLDFAFYGMGFNSPQTLSSFWLAHPLSNSSPATKSNPWWADSANLNSAPASAIHGVLRRNMERGLASGTAAAIAGSLLFIVLAARLERRQMLIWTFAAIGVLLVVTVGIFAAALHRSDAGRAGLLFLWNLMQFFMSFGPNTLVFIIPAEIFPTRYRCSLYGLSAASGKLGALIAQLIVTYTPSTIGDPDSDQFRWLLLLFALSMFLGAGAAWLAIPEVQDSRRWARGGALWKRPLRLLSLERLEDKLLEDLCDDGAILGFFERKNGLE